jgi:hypothetical protein
MKVDGFIRRSDMPQWAQLLAEFPTPFPELRNGHWYRVEQRTDEGLAKLIDVPTGVAYPVHEDRLWIIDEEPDFVTRIPLAPGAARHSDVGEVDVKYGGVCPRGHLLAELSADAPEAECPECGRVFRIEDEKHSKAD